MVVPATLAGHRPPLPTTQGGYAPIRLDVRKHTHREEGEPGRGGQQGTRPRAGQLGGPASRGLVNSQQSTVNREEGEPGRGGQQGTRPRAGQLGGPASRGSQNIPHPDQSRRRTHRIFLTPANRAGIPTEYSSPRPIAQAYPQNIPHHDQSRRRTHRIFLTTTNRAGVPTEYSSPRPIAQTYPQNIPHPDQSCAALPARPFCWRQHAPSPPPSPPVSKAP
eukprot:1184515-Prorocentrum_minimum.AAC.2